MEELITGTIDDVLQMLGIDPQDRRKEIIDNALIGKWNDLNRLHKNALAFGEEIFDQKAFAQIIRETFYTIKSFKERILGEEKNSSSPIEAGKDITPGDVFDYSWLLAEISAYAADVYTDDSENCVFTASRMIAQALCTFASFSVTVAEEGNGIFSGDAETWDAWIPTAEEDDDFWKQTFTYKIDDGDMSEIIELARRAF